MTRRTRAKDRSRRTLIVLVTVVTLVLFGSCDQQNVRVLEREPLFRLEIGRLEDQLDIITRNGVLPRLRTSVAMQDGFIFVGNGPANKVMEFTSFGDLIRLIYDPVQNPEPITLGATGGSNDSETGRTRFATEYGFGQLGVITVDSRRYVYAEDFLPAERSVFDEELGVQLNRIVVRFDDEGTPLDYIGQEGIGGTPFPFIERLGVTVRDELVVVAKTMDARFLYMYTRDGEQMYTARIGLDRLPVPDAETDYIAVLDEIVPGVDRYRMYLKISYYRTATDAETGKEFGISLDHSRVYWLDLTTGRYEGYYELPAADEDHSDQHYELIGTTVGEYAYLTTRIGSGETRLLIMNDAGRVVRRRNLYTPETDLVIREFFLSPEGVLTALFGYTDRAELVWWRADRLLPEIDEGGDNGET